METMTSRRAAVAAGFVTRPTAPALAPIQGTDLPVAGHIAPWSGASAGGRAVGLYKRLHSAFEHDSVRETLPV
jgi:hypothetical protein